MSIATTELARELTAEVVRAATHLVELRRLSETDRRYRPAEMRAAITALERAVDNHRAWGKS